MNDGGGPGAGGSGGGGTGDSGSGGSAGTANTGGGGGAGGARSGNASAGGAGGSGIIILRYPNTKTITIGAGLTTSHVNQAVGANERYTRFTGGTGTVSWS